MINHSNPPRLLLIAPPQSYRIAAFLSAAKKLGVEVQIASNGEHSLVAAVAMGLHIDTNNHEASLKTIEAAAKERPYAAIIATEDHTVALAAAAANRLGLPSNPPHAAAISQRKDLSRGCLQHTGVPVPKHRVIDLTRDLAHQIDGFPMPCVVKPLSLSASRGVIRANSVHEFRQACRRIGDIIADQVNPIERHTLLVEQYIPGIEIALEGILDNGKLSLLALFDKPDPLEGPFFEESYYITPSRLEPHLQKLAVQRVQQACRAYGLVMGPIHAELRIHDGEAWILEVAARSIGGECSRLLDNCFNHSLEEIIIAQALGNPVNLQSRQSGAGVLMIPTPKTGILRRVEGVAAALQVPHVEDVRIVIREGHELVILPEGSAYLGFIFAQAEDPETVESALRAAHACLNIVVGPLWKIQGQPHST